MTKDYSKYKDILEDEKSILIEELGGLGKMNVKTGDWEATPIIEETATLESDDADKADHFEDYEERTSTLNTLELRLRNIDLALQKIKENKFGICEVCNKPIEETRLEINPSSRTCIEHRGNTV